MDFSLHSKPSAPPPPLFRRSFYFLSKPSRTCQLPISPPFSKKNHQTMAILGKKQQPKKRFEGLSEEMNLIASEKLDFAPARRRVRSAFIETQQELDHPLFKLAPLGIRTEEWYEKNSNDLEIFCKSWLPGQGVRIKGVVFFCHGYGDTCTFFFEGIAKRIATAGYAVYAIDHPGFGLSEGLHGYIPSFDGLVDNVIECYLKIKGRPEASGLPRFLLGQSMGGALALKAHLKHPNEWDGVVLVAPMCRAVYNVISYSHQMRLRTAVQLLKATDEIETQVEKVSSPLLILHGASDRVTDPLVSKFVYEKASSKDKTLKIYPEGYHCILEGEPDERISTVLDNITSWLDARCGPK